MTQWTLMSRQAHPLRLAGPIIEAELTGLVIGELCDIRPNWKSREVVARAQVLGFHHDSTILSLVGSAQGLSRESVIHPTGTFAHVNVGTGLLGCVLDPSGAVLESLCETKTSIENECRIIDGTPPTYHQRASIDSPFYTGIRAIDGLLTCGIGQRIGIFASAGCGKTTLMHSLIEHAQADVFVIGLIGERGREVTEFVDILRKSKRKSQCVVVFATSDYSALERNNAALTATTVAEYFRDQGKNVVLFLDSITRYARALRDVALAAGEPPARRGYPASVFDRLPRVLERPGKTRSGSITAFYTILLESEDDSDPIADEIRSILDGHIYLSRKLAAKNHYPAIDVLHSISRVASQVCQTEHLQSAGNVRALLAKLDELQVFLELGEYKAGENEDNDRVINKSPMLNHFLQQPVSEYTDFQSVLSCMNEITA